jgi:spore coat protein U-like protein
MARKGRRGSVKAANCAHMKQRMAVLLMLAMLPWTGLNAQQASSTTFRVATKVEESCDVAAHGRKLLRATCTPNTTYHFNLNKRASPGPGTETGVGTGQAVDHTLFGSPASKFVPAGEFAETVTVHVYY